MSINSLEYAAVFMAELDKQVVNGATSGWMEQNGGQVKYNGGNEIKIPKISMDGLADYDRDKGFTQGAVTLEYQTLTMTQDRNRTFMLDRMDVDETNFAASAGNVMGEFQKTRVIPEIDAYRYSRLAALATGENTKTGYTPEADTMLRAIREDIYKIWDIVGDNGVELVISMSIQAAKLLSDAPEIKKTLDVTDFKKGDITFKVQSIDEIPIIKVPSLRMFTEYKFKTGGIGQEEGGFVKTEDAKQINWLITGRKTPIAVSKTDKIRIFQPDENLMADAWKLDYRKYHDIWVKDNQKTLLVVNTQ